jgi:hypothetical protein
MIHLNIKTFHDLFNQWGKERKATSLCTDQGPLSDTLSWRLRVRVRPILMSATLNARPRQIPRKTLTSKCSFWRAIELMIVMITGWKYGPHPIWSLLNKMPHLQSDPLCALYLQNPSSLLLLAWQHPIWHFEPSFTACHPRLDLGFLQISEYCSVHLGCSPMALLEMSSPNSWC